MGQLYKFRQEALNTYMPWESGLDRQFWYILNAINTRKCPDHRVLGEAYLTKNTKQSPSFTRHQTMHSNTIVQIEISCQVPDIDSSIDWFEHSQKQVYSILLVTVCRIKLYTEALFFLKATVNSTTLSWHFKMINQ